MQKQLANGLILRSLSEGYASDRERLPQFYADVNSEHDNELGKEQTRVLTRDLMNGHSTTTLEDIFVVVDPAQDDRIASATLLIPQTWRYETIPIKVGRPEMVGTLPPYRGRGLVRELFEVIHQRSAALGHQLQVITGIPYFYRQFGYAMAVDLGEEHASIPLHAVADAAPDYQPAFTLREATTDDIPNLIQWHDYLARERLLTELRSTDEWRYEINGRTPASPLCLTFLIITSATGEDVGYVEVYTHLPAMDREVVDCTGYVVGDPSSYLATYDDVIRGIKQWAIAKYRFCPALLKFSAGVHDALDSLINRTKGAAVRGPDYLWLLRVPEMIPFLWLLQPVLEQRLAGSGANRYTGELKIGFYDLTGISIKFECGRLAAIDNISGKDGYDISFPYHMLWNVVFGHHSYDELRAILPEVWASGKSAVLLDALFPKKKSWLKGLM
ncbi:MAG: GNAT family N-acetyltransferase [Anaerolineaceae bacterium]|nr:GNAT family N-acetyltransferase [Anaerolineaceae bacterium]